MRDSKYMLKNTDKIICDKFTWVGSVPAQEQKIANHILKINILYLYVVLGAFVIYPP